VTWVALPHPRELPGSEEVESLCPCRIQLQLLLELVQHCPLDVPSLPRVAVAPSLALPASIAGHLHPLLREPH